MKNILRNMAAVAFLVLFLPYTVTLLVQGRDGIGGDKRMTSLEYQVMEGMLREDYSWMEEESLKLMAVILRTEYAAGQEDNCHEKTMDTLYGSYYERVRQAVLDTAGQVVMIHGEYRELPYHAVSAGSTRDGLLLGEDYDYVLPVECPEDLKSDSFLQICYLTEEEISQALGQEVTSEDLVLERDRSEYITRVSCGDTVWQGENFRTLLHLPSSCFWMEKRDPEIRFTVKGSGHGFGISLYTADQMAKEGADWTEMIHKFYKNAECITIP